jgi:hypothetical protein
MFVKETKVKRAGREYVYLQLVDGYRDKAGKVKHRVVANLGRKDALKDSGQLEALAGSFARLDPPMAGTRRSVGPLLLVEHFLRQLEVRDTVDGALPRSARSILSVGEVVCALVASRLCSPSPLYDVAGWASGAAVRELLGIPPALLNDDRLGRALETFAVYAEDVRSRIAGQAIATYGIAAGRLHVDLTTVGISGAYEQSALIAKGWASDRRVARQVRTLQASTPDGTVLYSRPDPGNAAELTLVGASLERLLEISGPGLLIVCDSAMGAPKTLREIDQAGVRFVVPLRASAGFRERFLTDCGHEALRPVKYVPEREAHRPAADRTRFRGALRDWEIPATETQPALTLRVAYIHSSEEAAQVAAARERALVKAEDELGRMHNGLGGRYYKTREQIERRVGQIIGSNITGLIAVTVNPDGAPLGVAWQRNLDAIADAAAFDGIYALATNLPGRITAGQILRLYKDQQIVERRHRDMKQSLKVRPIFLHNDDRVYALLSIVGISLLIFGLIEARTRAALGHEQQLPGLLPEGRSARPTGRNILAAFQGLGLTYTQAGIQLDTLTDTQQHILELLQIQLPWPTHTDHPLTNRGKRG